jgi:hypothetical protein
MRRTVIVFGIICFKAMLAFAKPGSEAAAPRDKLEVGDNKILTMPSAGTVGSGKLFFTDYQLGILTLSYGVSDDVELSGALTLPIFQVGGFLGAKWRFYQKENTRLAIFGGFGAEWFYAGLDILLTGGALGPAVDLCISKGCSSFVSFSGLIFGGVGVLAWHEAKGTGKAIGFLPGVGAVFSVVKKLKLLLELKAAMAKSTESELASVVFFNYGLRVHGSEFAADIGFIRPFVSFVGTDAYSVEGAMKYLPLGYPWLAFGYQW